VSFAWSKNIRAHNLVGTVVATDLHGLAVDGDHFGHDGGLGGGQLLRDGLENFA